MLDVPLAIVDATVLTRAGWENVENLDTSPTGLWCCQSRRESFYWWNRQNCP
jgi:hypothetical protein